MKLCDFHLFVFFFNRRDNFREKKNKEKSRMSCEICHQNDKAPYKCPQCRIKYCSVICYQTHKTSEICKEPVLSSTSSTMTTTAATGQQGKTHDDEEAQSTSIDLNEEEETDRLAPEVLQRIGYSTELRDLLKNRHLRTMIKMLSKSISPADDMQKAMLEPIFVQFVDQLLLVVENKDQQ